MSEVIAQQLAGLYRELADRRPFSDTTRVDLSAAAAFGNVDWLLICQCDTDGLELLSFFRRWWIVDGAGFHANPKWPLTQAMIQRDGWEANFPFVKFATDGRRVQFGMRFGPDWYVAKEGPLNADGRFVPDQLVELFHSLKLTV